MRLLSILCVINLVASEPQLDLPRTVSTPSPVRNGRDGPDVSVLPNSYADGSRVLNEKSAATSFDSDDRSQRFGPPYDSNENDEYASNQRDNERLRYNDNNRYNYDTNRDNVRFPLNNNENDFNSANPQYPPVNPLTGPQKFPINLPENAGDYPNRFGDGYNNNRYGDPYSNPNPYDAEYERQIRVQTEKLRQLLLEVEAKSSTECSLNVAAQWNFETNVNEITQLEAINAQQRYADYMRSIWQQIKVIEKGAVYDEKLYRQIKLLSTIGPSALPADQLDRYNRIINDLLAIYNTATICGYEQPFECSLRLQPHLRDIMAKSRDWDELTWVWTEWRRKAGKPMRDLFDQLVDLTNDAANYNNFTDATNYWSFAFDSENFRYEMEEVWKEILPLYEMIHAYVRRKLREFYGPNKINRNAPLPAHILGNMYGQSWNILDLTVPYPGRSNIDVTPAMRAQGYTPLVMFQLAEEFYTSMNMSALPPEFWAQSIFEEPVERPVLCQPSAWDFCNGVDYRIKMCTDVTHKDFITVHHELAHIQYFLNYRNNPKVFRDGANPGFHDAIGDAVTISLTPKHLQSLGLIAKSVDDTAHDINFLFAMAMDKVVFLPYALALEQWRYDVFSKRVSKEQYNCHWWRLREQYGGVKPPVLRSELDFDPGAKYHVAANVPYMNSDGTVVTPSIYICQGSGAGKMAWIAVCRKKNSSSVLLRYFFAAVFQFQLHRAMCIASREFDPTNPSKPLHKCSIYRHPEAGDILKKLMAKGASQPWQQTLQEVIGEGRLDGSAVREYFRPLEEWLRNENLRNQEYVGWLYDGDYCKKSIETADLQVFGGFYNDASYASMNVLALVVPICLRFFN